MCSAGMQQRPIRAPVTSCLSSPENRKRKFMNDLSWKKFFLICAEYLGSGDQLAAKSDSWCAWTTFRRIEEEFGYWTSGLPRAAEIRETCIADGGVWGQPFIYSELAHIVIPRTFYWESYSESGFESGVRSQKIDELSAGLRDAGIGHRLTNLVLEVKLY